MTKLSKTRNTKMHLQSGLCFYCGQPMWAEDIRGFCQRHGVSAKRAKLLRCTAEHLTARCDGGRDDADNIVAACFYCNRGRHKPRNPMAPHRYREEVRTRLASGGWHQFTASPISR